MIKNYTPDDFDRCCELYIQVFNGAPWFDKWTSESARAHVRELVDDNNFVGFTAWDGDLVGAAFARTRTFYSGTELFIEELFIAPNCQRKGIGTALMREVESYAKSIAATNITLITGAGYPSFDFFAKCGCKHVDALAFMHKRVK
jgi:GNAT superfamily N-acetyltransferase